MSQAKDAEFLTPRQVVQRWAGAVTTGTLANWRSKGVGPTYSKMRHRILYPVAALAEFEAKNAHPANDNADEVKARA